MSDIASDVGDGIKALYLWVSYLVGGLTWLGVFIYAMVYAWTEWGWLIACAFGWIPSAIVATFAAVVAGFLWPVAAFLIGALIFQQTRG